MAIMPWMYTGSFVRTRREGEEGEFHFREKMVKESEHLAYKDRLSKLGLLCVEKMRLRGDPDDAYKYLKKEEEERDRHFSVASSDRTVSTGTNQNT